MPNNLPTDFSLIPAALGTVAPAGWLRRQLVVQKNGLTGNIDALWEDLGGQSGWLGGAGENWERGPYYLDGLIPLAWALGDEALQQKAQVWIEWMLQSQNDEGFFGPADNPDWWPRMVALKALTQYHEATGDARVLPLMERYFRFQQEHLPQQPLSMWAAARGQEQLLPMLTLYRLTGADYLPRLADELRAQTQAIIVSDTFEEFAQPLMKKLGWPTIFCNSLEVDRDGMLCGIKMRCAHSKLTTVRGLQSIGFETIASGDSYNDLEMIEASKAGFLFRTTEKIKHDYPHLPAFEGYDELLAAIEQVIRA